MLWLCGGLPPAVCPSLAPSCPLAQVTKVSPTSTNARIMCCAGQALKANFTGVIRQQDVRSHEVDKVCVWGGEGGLQTCVQ